MVKYRYQGEDFVIEDFQNAKTFASFLPAIAGRDGKPLWAFYANVGQVMGGFGVNNKETPITPFDSATLAYQNIPTKSFRSFVKVDGKVYSPFFRSSASQIMITSFSDLKIKEENEMFRYEITYTTVPHRHYAALVRHVKITNISGSKNKFELLDGLPVFFPNGLSNFSYKEMVSLMAAYCQIEGLENKIPFVKFKTSTSDNAIVEEAVTGNGFFSLDQDNKKLTPIIDLALVFSKDKSLFMAEGFEKMSYDELENASQQTENKLPCAFTLCQKELEDQESYSFVSLYGMFDTNQIYQDAVKNESFESLINCEVENRELMKDLLSACTVKTSNKLFDLYMKQSFLDNNLRGGFPCKLSNSLETYYVFGRKHGDMERDYNAFQIPARYYSSGTGNFRDVNQNRRSDLYFYPFVEDYNIRLFFNLIQADGQNPLNVKPLKFVKTKEFTSRAFSNILSPLKEQIVEIVDRGFEPSELFIALKDNEKALTKGVDDIFTEIIEGCEQQIEANFAEGYWIDHWTYNVDLLENYASVYPDKLEDVLFKNDYYYFYSKVMVEPRDEKYCLLPDGKVRQYGAIDLKKAKRRAEKTNMSLNKTYWLKDNEENKITTSLANKIFSLIVVKFSTLDSNQLGIEMECEKPGWNDAMNGLPGLFASGMSETIELLRLVNFALDTFEDNKDHQLKMFKEQYDFYNSVQKCVSELMNNNLSRFNYWNKVTRSREIYRESIRSFGSSENKMLDLDKAIELLKQIKEILTDGIARAKEIGNGIIPSYLVYEVVDYELTNKINHLGYPTVRVKEFKLQTIPYFLEASARVMKLKGMVNSEDYLRIKDTDLYDSKLGIYKTCANLDDAPFEIGRVHAFTKGWLERECNFLHMTYKYLLGLLKSSLYDEFYQELKNNFTINMDPYVYGRNPVENSSFIVPTCNPDSSLHGQGFFARLTGANAEVMNMYSLLFMGEKIFTYEKGQLQFALKPLLSSDFFDDNDEVSFNLFSSIKVTYHNPKRLDLYKGVKLLYKINKYKGYQVNPELSLAIREKRVSEIYIEVEEK